MTETLIEDRRRSSNSRADVSPHKDAARQESCWKSSHAGSPGRVRQRLVSRGRRGRRTRRVVRWSGRSKFVVGRRGPARIRALRVSRNAFLTLPLAHESTVPIYPPKIDQPMPLGERSESDWPRCELPVGSSPATRRRSRPCRARPPKCHRQRRSCPAGPRDRQIRPSRRNGRRSA